MEYGREATDVCSWRLQGFIYKELRHAAAGNLSSIYQTLIAVTNLANQRFYHEDDIVNDFLERMSGLLPDKVDQLAGKFAARFSGTESARASSATSCGRNSPSRRPNMCGTWRRPKTSLKVISGAK